MKNEFGSSGGNALMPFHARIRSSSGFLLPFRYSTCNDSIDGRTLTPDALFMIYPASFVGGIRVWPPGFERKQVVNKTFKLTLNRIRFIQIACGILKALIGGPWAGPRGHLIASMGADTRNRRSTPSGKGLRLQIVGML
ncbi:hypothetical protein BCEP27_30389 [Burkholderia cepacia]